MLDNKKKQTKLEQLIAYAIRTNKTNTHILTIPAIPEALLKEGMILARLRQTVCAMNMGYAHTLDFDILADAEPNFNTLAELTKEDIGGIGEAIIKSLTSPDSYQTPYIDDFIDFNQSHRGNPDFKLDNSRIDIKTVRQDRQNIAATKENITNYSYILAIRLVPVDELKKTIAAELYIFDTAKKENWQEKPGVLLADGRQKPDYYLIPLTKKEAVND